MSKVVRSPTSVYLPAIVASAIDTSKIEHLPMAVHTKSVHSVENVGKLCAQYAKAFRIKLRINPEVYLSGSNYKGYSRLNTCITLACSTPEQAQLALEAISRFAQSLDGIWLAPPAPSPHSGSKTPGEG